MAGVSDKARFYLERAAPELREFEEKEIFTKVCALRALLLILTSALILIEPPLTSPAYTRTRSAPL